MHIDQDLIYAVVAAQGEPDLQHGYALNRQKTLRRAVGQWPQSSPETSRKKKGFHSKASICEGVHLHFMRDFPPIHLIW
jgi:hypothetical protein